MVICDTSVGGDCAETFANSSNGDSCEAGLGESKVFWGLARPPTSYGAYSGGDEKNAKWVTECLISSLFILGGLFTAMCEPAGTCDDPNATYNMPLHNQLLSLTYSADTELVMLLHMQVCF
jgi:hypothetical protein